MGGKKRNTERPDSCEKGEIVYDPSYRTENCDGLCDDLCYHHHQLFSGTYHAGRSSDPSEVGQEEYYYLLDNDPGDPE